MPSTRLRLRGLSHHYTVSRVCHRVTRMWAHSAIAVAGVVSAVVVSVPHIHTAYNWGLLPGPRSTFQSERWPSPITAGYLSMGSDKVRPIPETVGGESHGPYGNLGCPNQHEAHRVSCASGKCAAAWGVMIVHSVLLRWCY
jgi:hypothetical protein